MKVTSVVAEGEAAELIGNVVTLTAEAPDRNLVSVRESIFKPLLDTTVINADGSKEY